MLAAQSVRGSGLLKAAFPFIRKLFKEKMQVALGVLWNKEVSYIYHGSPQLKLEEGIGNSDLFPAHKSSIGLAIMAKNPRKKFSHSKNLIPQKLPVKNAIAIKNDHNEISIAVAIGSSPIAGLALVGKIAHNRLQHYADILNKAAYGIEAALK